MNEPTDLKDPEDVIVDETILSWKNGLTNSFNSPPAPELYGKENVPPEEIYKHFDSKVQEEERLIATDPSCAVALAKRLEDMERNEPRASDNFYKLLSPKGARESREGQITFTLSVLKPFYINLRYNGAWSRMCEQFPEDARRVILFMQKKDAGISGIDVTDVENKSLDASLNKLILHLIKTEGIDQGFLTK